MPDERENQPHQVAIIEPGRHGARLRIPGAESGSDDDSDPATTRPRRRAEAPSTTDAEAEAPHPMLRFTTEDLRVELARRQRQVEYLRLQHGALLRQLADLEAQIARLSPSGRPPAATEARVPRAPRARRAPVADNTSSLADALAQAVAVDETVTPAEAARRALAAGYKSNAQRFGVLVATALAKDGRFERLGRGSYRRTR